MKPLPFTLNRLLSDPAYQQISGKLLKIFDDKSRIIVELKDKKVKSLFGPFPDVELSKLFEKAIVAFVREGEATRIFDAKQIPKERSAGGTASDGSTAEPKAKTASGPRVKWKKYAEGLMIGEAVKLSGMQRGFGLEEEFIREILVHLQIGDALAAKDIAYLDFRKVFHFLNSPGFKPFQNAHSPKSVKAK